MNRATPALPPGAYVTYQISSPPGRRDYWVDVGCAEVDCEAYVSGWVTCVDEATDLGARQAQFIRADQTRRHTETKTDAGWTAFTFPAGQPCFRAHQIRTGRPELYTVRGGDWRALIGTPRVYDRADQWVDDFASHQQRLLDAQQ
jgi:hypothetical protein